MNKIFISHAWDVNEEKDAKLDQFIRVLKDCLEDRDFTVIWDKGTYHKRGTLSDFMQRELDESVAIICCCNEKYFLNSLVPGKGVKFEVDYIIEKKYTNKTLILNLGELNKPVENIIPLQLQGLEYKDFRGFLEETTYERITCIEENATFKQLLRSLNDILQDSQIESKIEIVEIAPDFKLELGKLGLIQNLMPAINMSDIFVYPDLKKNAQKSFIDSENLIHEKLFINEKLFITGEKQSGKTTLAYKYFFDLFENGYFPIYLKPENFKGKWKNKIKKIAAIQYLNLNFEENKNRVVIIVDDFHLLHSKQIELIIEDTEFNQAIYFIDEIFYIQFNDQINKKNVYSIMQFKSSKRYELVSNISKHESIVNHNVNDITNWIETKNNELDTTIGAQNAINKKIIPAYPIFLLTILGASLKNNFDLKKLTSFGHFYNVLITFSFYKIGLTEQEISTYLKILSELSFYYFKNFKSNDLQFEDLNKFLDIYKSKYYLPESNEVYLNNLIFSKILEKDSFGVYKFSYPYIYYYFLGMYFAQNLSNCETELKELMDRLDLYENSQICIFIAHFDYSESFIQTLTKNLNSFNKDLSEATLSRSEIQKFNQQLEENIYLKFPQPDSPTKNIRKKLEFKDSIEIEKELSNVEEDGDSTDEIDYNPIRLMIQTAEVSGEIIKNRYGTISRDQLEELILATVNSNFRLIKEFCNLVEQIEFDKLFSELNAVLEREIGEEVFQSEFVNKLKKFLIRIIFSIIAILVNKTIDSIGSSKVLPIFKELFNDKESPLVYLIEKGIEMRYMHYLNYNEISSKLKSKELSNIVKSNLELLIYEYISFQSMTNSKRQQLYRLLSARSGDRISDSISSQLNKKELVDKILND
ncbi:toll/interleukin-1 receptor domain-containing protein [Streptococcus sp. 2018037]|uniref:Toll/interleukin-1 receptor domain-containing protein n=3 Tax=Streptococcus suis TaxID=1307 RepID=A0AAW5LK23_STRSU|nr:MULTISPECIES: toll/interleukin-1 receptor domain-containing protein [Streptococcus]MBM7268132.1 toll/interleukin-1 receptor domain-containing protein [Streptococcus suis]MBY0753283.1 toll/interleukin-1 receptor domain-containing protein [Streptococcus sp. 2018037]MCL4882459.1 toll/interleukin-1 receptor domain-containing protein [Streptococcus suis]MCR1232425.1 toll/interleukin-1 receptor domain-containing protein [Streptococcus suis]